MKENEPNLRIYLVGFMGVGKSTAGKKLAKKLGFDFVDLDDIFEAKYKISIHSFFDKYGEDLFRKLEYKLLVETLKLKNTVISTGGGTACFFDAMKFMNDNGLTIYLMMTVEEIVSRLKEAKRKRPLVLNKSETELFEVVKEKLAERNKFYSQSHLSIPSMDIDLNKLVELIKEI